MALTLASRVESDATVLSVEGDIDVQSAGQLRAALDDATSAAGSSGTGDLVVDLAGTDFLDSSALGVFVAVNKHFENGTARFTIVCDKPHLLKVFEITRLRDVLRVVPTVDAAVT